MHLSNFEGKKYNKIKINNKHMKKLFVYLVAGTFSLEYLLHVATKGVQRQESLKLLVGTTMILKMADLKKHNIWVKLTHQD